VHTVLQFAFNRTIACRSGQACAGNYASFQ
jgi:hypothetical protein